MMLAAFLSEVYLLSRIEVCRGYAEALQTTVRKFSVWLGREALLTDLTERNVCGYLTEYRKHWSARATNNQRAHLITLWLAAVDYDSMLVPPHTRRIRKLRAHPDTPVAWTVEEIARLLAAAGMLTGTVAGVPAADWWSALLLTIYWTGCRIMAMLATETDCYRSKHGVMVRPQKNRVPQWYPLPQTCRERIEATRPRTRRLLFPYDKYPKTIYVDFRRIVEQAGLFAPKRRLNLFHKIRRTNVSYCAAVDPAIAQRQAGHADYRTTLASYVDPTIAGFRSAADVIPDPLRLSPHFRIYG